MKEKSEITFYNVFGDLYWVFLFYVIGDVVTTYCILPYGIEGNPIMSWVIATTGFTGLIVVKIIFMIMMYYTSGYMISRGYLNIWKLLVKIIIVLGIILTVNNIAVYLTGIGVI